MKERSVVTVFLERGGKVALFRRSGQVATYVGKFAAVSGGIDEGASPFEQARKEVMEETGLVEEVTLLAEGDVVQIEAPEYDAVFVVHPFLVHLEGPEIRMNFEHDGMEWIAPSELDNYDTVPGLRQVFQSVGSAEALIRTMDRLKREIASDRTSGSLGLAARGVNVLAIAELMRSWYGDGSRESFFELAEEVANLRGGMEVIRNAAAACALEAQRGGEGVLSDRLFSLGHQFVAQRETVARNAANWIREHNVRRVVTVSWSTSVYETLVACGRDQVAVHLVESSPGGEGVHLAEKLAREGFRVTLYPDSSLHVAVRNADAVLLGADAVLSSGSFVNKTGSFLACSLAERMGVPTLVVTETIKFSPTSIWQRETAPWRPSLYSGPNLTVWTEPFEETPGELVHRFLTDRGELTVEEAQAICVNVQDELMRYGLVHSFFGTAR